MLMSNNISITELIEGKDFYWINGYRVFTESYLLKRNYCCKNSCKHCPYKKQTTKNGKIQ